MNRSEAPAGPKKPPRRPGRSPLARLVGIVTGAILILLALPFLLLAAWGLLFDAPTLAALALMAAWVLFPVLNRVRPIRVLKLAVLFVLVPATLALAPVIVHEVDRKIEQLSRKPRADAGAFTLLDRIGIYGLNAMMGAVGYPFYPEASQETLLLMFAPGPSARRAFHSDFALGSRKVRGCLRNFADSLRLADSSSFRSYGPVRVEWSKYEYRLTEPEARYALALNQTRLTARAERRGERWLMSVRCEMEVKYPQSNYVTLIGRPQLRVEEGLFSVLQNCGWLHPYIAEYRFPVYSDDRRLR